MPDSLSNLPWTCLPALHLCQHPVVESEPRQFRKHFAYPSPMSLAGIWVPFLFFLVKVFSLIVTTYDGNFLFTGQERNVWISCAFLVAGVCLLDPELRERWEIVETMESQEENEMSPLFLSRVHVRTGKAISIQSHCDLLYFLWNQPHTNRGGRKSLLTNYRFSPKLDSSLLFFPSQATIPKSQIYEFTLFFLLLYRSLHPRLIHGPLVSFTGFTFP